MISIIDVRDHMMKLTKGQTILLVILLVGFILVAGKMDFEDEANDQAIYCDMVAKHKQDASTGWPDFKGNYDQVCK